MRGQDEDELVLVGSEAVSSVEVLDTLNAFLVKGFRVRCCMEIEITWLSPYQSFVRNLLRTDGPPRISSLPSPLRTILTPIALIFLLSRYIGVLARTVVTS